MRSFTGLIGATLLLLASDGCFTASLDPSLVDVFACTRDNECPSGMVCANQTCEDPASLPNIQITNPESAQRVGIAGLGGKLGLVVRGNLQLVPAGDAMMHVPGEGHLVIAVDGQDVAKVDSGDLTKGIMVTVPFVNPSAGPHRLMAIATRNDDIPYDNDTATATRMFFADDCPTANDPSCPPYIGILVPEDGASLSLDKQQINLAIATLRFQVVAPGTGTAPHRGHVHVYYDQKPPEACVADPVCDGSYFAIVSDTKPDDPHIAVGLGTIPAEMGSRPVQLSAILRNIDHSLYMPPVYDAIQIQRGGG